MSWLLPTWLDHHHQGGQQVIFFSYFTKYLKQINFKNHHIFCTAGLTDNDEVAFSVKGAACPPVQVSGSRNRIWMLAPHSTWHANVIEKGNITTSCRSLVIYHNSSYESDLLDWWFQHVNSFLTNLGYWLYICFLRLGWSLLQCVA